MNALLSHVPRLGIAIILAATLLTTGCETITIAGRTFTDTEIADRLVEHEDDIQKAAKVVTRLALRRIDDVEKRESVRVSSQRVHTSRQAMPESSDNWLVSSMDGCAMIDEYPDAGTGGLDAIEKDSI